MSHTHAHKPHLPDDDIPDEPEPGTPPVEPDEGPVPVHLPGNPEHERVREPGGANRNRFSAAG